MTCWGACQTGGRPKKEREKNKTVQMGGKNKIKRESFERSTCRLRQNLLGVRMCVTEISSVQSVVAFVKGKMKIGLKKINKDIVTDGCSGM